MAQTHSLDLEKDSSQYASIADASQTGLDITTDFTIEAWVKLESQPNTEMYFAAKYDNNNNKREYAVGYVDVSGTKKLRLVASSNGTGATLLDLTYTINTGVWYHLAWTYDVSAGQAEFYVNGKSVGTVSGGPTSLHTDTSAFVIGALNNTGSGNYVDGMIKDVRVFNDIRTASEIVSDARTENVSDANLVGEWNFNNAYTDSSGNSNTLTASGSPVFSVDIPWHAPTGISSEDYVYRAVRASSQYAYVNDHADFDFSTVYTFEGWVYLDTEPANNNNYELFSKWNDLSSKGYECIYTNDSGTRRFRMYSSSDGSNQGNANVDYTLPIRKWTHVACVYTSGTFKLYINGVLIGSATGTLHSSLNNSTDSFKIGQGGGNTSGYWDGMFRDVRVFNDERTQSEIVADALASTVSDANLVAEWSLNNVYTDASGNGHTLTAVNTPTFVQWKNFIAGGVVSYWTMDEASSANRADSTGKGHTATNTGTVNAATGIISNGATNWSQTNHLWVSDNDDFDCSGAFSIALWIKSSAWTAASMVMLSKMPSGGGNGWKLYLQANGGAPVFQTNGANNHIATGSLSTTTWYHLVVTRESGGNITFYLDGKTDTAPQSYTAANANTDSLLFGKTAEESRPMNANAVFDEIAFYTRALSYGEVLDLYNAGSGITFSSTPATLSISVSDQLNLTESVTMLVASFVNVSDQLNLTESVSIVSILNIDVNDQITVTDTATVESGGTFNISVSDQINLTEDVTVFIPFFNIIVSDQLNVTESVSTAIAVDISVSDSITISESATTTVVSNINVSDQLSVSESVTMEVTSFISVSDQLNITESNTLTVSDIPTGFAIMRGRDQDLPVTLSQQEYPLGMRDQAQM